MKADVFEHMEEAWKIERNPFPAEAIRIQNTDQPYSEGVFPDENERISQKVHSRGHSGRAGDWVSLVARHPR